ncbi:MAG: sulfotransferase [Gammaproteobacteria bacterium]|nr:sulfotransferase [Gammaproteobacteria bacterium]
MTDNRWSSANIRFQLTRAALMPMLDQQSSTAYRAPLVIGGMGGSGTRLPVMLLERAGYWFGSWVNPKTKDAMAPRWLLENAFNRLVVAADHPDLELEELFMRLIYFHRWGIPDPNGLWGWKNPRSMWIIPFLSRLYPDMKFIHVIRNGRDMALTGNENLLRKHGAFLLDDTAYAKDIVHAQFKLWALGNRLAREAGEKYLGENYLLLNYNQLCCSPATEMNRLFNYIGVEDSSVLVEECMQSISTSRYSERWRQSDHPLVQNPDHNLRQALDLFGYE